MYKACGFKFFRLYEDAKLVAKDRSIGYNALFLGYNAATLLSARDYPACKPSFIYCTDNYNNINEYFI
jgi:hypothetical protein